MALPVFVDSNSNNTNSAGTTGTVNAPLTVVEGDLMILTVGFDTAASLTTLAGWNIIGSVQAAAANVKNGAYYRIADSTDVAVAGVPPTYTWTFTVATSTSAFAVAAYRGVYGNIDANSQGVGTTSQAVTSVALTSVSKCNMCVFIRGTRDDTSTTSNAVNTSASAGVTKRVEGICTIGGAAVHSATIFDRITPFQAAGTITTISTSSTTASPTHSISRSISLNVSPDQGIWDINQTTANRGAQW